MVGAARSKLARRAALAWLYAAACACFGSGCHCIVGTDHELRADDVGVTSSTSGSGSGGDGGSASQGGSGGVAVGGSGGSAGGFGGSAGHGGMPCAADTAAPGTPVAIAKGQLRPAAMAMDNDWIYWINEPSSDAAGDGAVMRVDKRGCAPPDVLASNLGRPVQLRTFTMGLYVYVTNESGPPGDVGVLAVPKTPGGSRVQLDPVGGGPLAAYFGYAYSEAWAAGEAVRVHRHATMQSDTGACDRYQAAAAGSRITALGVDPGTGLLFFADTVEATGTSALFRAASDCGAAVEEAVALDQPAIRDIGFEGAHVLWITADAVYRIAKSATPADTPELLATFDGGDLVNVIVPQSQPALTNRAAGTVTRIPAPGTSVDVATGQGEPYGMVGNAVLYWTNRTGGQVMRLEDWASVE